MSHIVNHTQRSESPDLSAAVLTKTTEAIYTRLVQSYYVGKVVSSEIDSQLAVQLASFCPKQDRENHPFEDCCRSILGYVSRFSGKVLDETLLRRISETVAGYATEFSFGQGLRPFDVTRGAWGICFVEDVMRRPEMRGRFCVALRVRSGPGVGLFIEQSFSGGFVQGILRRVGAGRGEHSPLELGGLWVATWMQSKDGRFRLDDVQAPPKLLSANQRILKARKGQCIGGYLKHDNCVVGCPFGRSRCKLSRHARDYIYGLCRSQQTVHKGFIAHDGYCLKCLMKNAIPNPQLMKEIEGDDSDYGGIE
jgi:hypothetical protein